MFQMRFKAERRRYRSVFDACDALLKNKRAAGRSKDLADADAIDGEDT